MNDLVVGLFLDLMRSGPIIIFATPSFLAAPMCLGPESEQMRLYCSEMFCIQELV